MHRAASKGMAQKPDPKAEKIKRRRAEKSAAKALVRAIVTGDRDAARTIKPDTRFAPLAPAPSENCPRCLARRKARAA